MKSKTALFAGAWAVTCAAAFFAGRTSESSGENNDSEASANAQTGNRRGLNRSGDGSSRRTSGNRGGSRKVSSGLSSEDIRAQAKALKALNDPIARAEGFLDFVQNLGPDEFLDAVDAFREGGIDNDQFGEYRLLLAAWAKVDPEGALAYASEKTGTAFARKTILAAWAKDNPGGAIEWAKNNFDNNGNEERANPWIVGVIEGMATYDTGGATQLLEELPFSRERGEALGVILSQVIEMGPDSAKAWAESLTDERLRAGAAARVAGEIAQTDPQGAIEWASSMGEDVMARSTGDIINRWANDDLSAARGWVESQPESVIAAAGPNLIDEMIEQEGIDNASAWLSNYEGNPEFDNTVRSFVWNSVREEPTVAADWIMRMSSERDRTGTFHRILGRWMERDREGAMNYINNKPVPDSIRERANRSQTER